MRALIFILTILFAVSISAQTREAAVQAFDDGTRAARTGQHEKALKNYERALSLTADEKTNSEFLARIQYNIGVCLFKMKRPTQAVEKFNAAIELSGKSYQKAYRALGMTETELRNWTAAGTAFRQALRLKNDDGESWFDLALALIEQKDFEAAREAFQNSIRYKTGAAADAHNNVGVILALSGDLPSAEKEFKIALRKSAGQSTEARRNLEFCKTYKQNSGRALAAKLIFSRIDKTGA